MRRSICTTLITVTLAAGCTRGGDAPIALAEITETRPLMPQIAAFAVEPTPSGAILRAAGLPPLQGYWDGVLVPVAQPDPSVLAYEFRALPPPVPTRVSTERSRYVDVAVFVDNDALAGISEIRVVAAQNARAARR